MCGIFGWVGTRDVDDARAVAWRALDAMYHRGPDGAGVWFSDDDSAERVCLAHRRLAIIDPEGGAQPFWSHDRRYVLTYNGEVYNYVELREALTAQGHRFTTGSDTEVVIEAFRRYDTAAFALFRGMFAFAIHDTQTGRTVLARDPVGKKPLFTAAIPGGLAFASEIAALLEHPGVVREVDLSQTHAYLVQRYVDGPATFFRGVSKVRPGHFLERTAGEWRETRYYAPPLTQLTPADTSLEDDTALFGAALDESVRLRLRSDAPYGLFLSGGIDSAVVLALMARHSNRAVRTFSVGFDDSKLSELTHAGETARRFGADHSALVLAPESFADTWGDAVRLRGAPVSEASDVPILLLAREAGKSVKMVLTGEGADELLGGYPKYRAEGFLKTYHSVFPPALHRRLLDPLISALPYEFQRLKILSRAASEGDLARRGQYWFASGDASTIARLAGGAPTVTRMTDSPAHLSALRALQLRDFETWLPDNLLERGDRMMMGGSIEGRMPFMDAKLAETVARFPDGHLTGHPKGKAILRRLAQSLLDPATIARPKIGFTVPVGDWFRGQLKGLMRDLLLCPKARVRGILHGTTLDTIVGEHLNRRQDHSKLLWGLTNLEQFLRQAA